MGGEDRGVKEQFHRADCLTLLTAEAYFRRSSSDDAARGGRSTSIDDRIQRPLRPGAGMPMKASGWRRSLLPILAVVSAAACEPEWKALIVQEKTPVQPIRFMHTVHVGIDSIPCAYCHFSTNISEEAGIPPVGTCMGCHRFVQGSTDEFKTEIQKLLEFAADSTPVPWTRVHSVPAFVQFPHKPHVRAGVTCAECHGDVAEMDVVSRVAPLTMGWCLDCHRDREAPDDCATCLY